MSRWCARTGGLREGGPPRSGWRVAKGFRVTVNCNASSNGEDPDDVASFFDTAMELGVEGNHRGSPGIIANHHAPRQDVFLGPQCQPNSCSVTFLEAAAGGPAGKNLRGSFQITSALFLDFLAGNQTYQCTNRGANPTYNVFGLARKPCLTCLSDEGPMPRPYKGPH